MIIVHPLPEGEFTVGQDKELRPFDPQNDNLQDRARGSLHVEIQPFLVITDNCIMLLDTGLGLADTNGQPKIYNNLLEHGLYPEDITKVFHSHLHKDHCGGMILLDKNGLGKPAFPNADYYLYRPEVDFALSKGSPSYDAVRLEMALSLLPVKWMDGDSGTIGDVTYLHSGGHCPQHIVFRITDGMDTVFYGGDEAPQLKQMQVRYRAKYDFDGEKAMNLRQQYWEEGAKNHWKFLFYHDVKSAVYQW